MKIVLFSVLKKNLLFGMEPHGGYNLRIHVNAAIHEEGLFWFDVILDAKLVTRMPLKIVVIRAADPAHSRVAKK